MKTRNYQLLVNAAGQLMQQHVFDHLPDEKLLRMNSCLHQLSMPEPRANWRSVETELLGYCREANLYVETATPELLHQWYAVMSCFGEVAMPSVMQEEAE